MAANAGKGPQNMVGFPVEANQKWVPSKKDTPSNLRLLKPPRKAEKNVQQWSMIPFDTNIFVSANGSKSSIWLRPLEKIKIKIFHVRNAGHPGCLLPKASLSSVWRRGHPRPNTKSANSPAARCRSLGSSGRVEGFHPRDTERKSRKLQRTSTPTPTLTP